MNEKAMLKGFSDIADVDASVAKAAAKIGRYRQTIAIRCTESRISKIRSLLICETILHR